jgi:hypothetical protein
MSLSPVGLAVLTLYEAGWAIKMNEGKKIENSSTGDRSAADCNYIFKVNTTIPHD